MGSGAVRVASVVVVAVAVFLGGCTMRSISDSGYGNSRNPAYRGELSEFDVLGIAPGSAASDAEIARQLIEHKPVEVAKGGAILLIQSGAALPDDDMVSALDAHFAVVPFSGVPAAPNAMAPDAYARALRLAAARSGTPVIVCYWGVLEAQAEGEALKAVSWVPILGTVVPDERQHMRIRLKLAVIDVASGNWTMIAPTPFQDMAWSAAINRGGSDQDQVGRLKHLAYVAAAADFARAVAR